MGKKESHYVTTQRADDPGRVTGSTFGRIGCSFCAGSGGLLDSLKKALAERALNAEMDYHLGGDEQVGNSRNGYGRKRVITDSSKIEIEVPRDRDALEALPGVGRKTANVVLNMAFGEPTIAVDTHIFRIGNRTGLAPGKTPLAVEKNLEKLTPNHYKLHAHHWLILHGRYVCKARKPDCAACVVNDLCRFKGKTL